MSSDKVEVRNFLAAMTPKVEQCTQPMTAQELANAFYGKNKDKNDDKNKDKDKNVATQSANQFKK